MLFVEDYPNTALNVRAGCTAAARAMYHSSSAKPAQNKKGGDRREQRVWNGNKNGTRKRGFKGNSLFPSPAPVKALLLKNLILAILTI